MPSRFATTFGYLNREVLGTYLISALQTRSGRTIVSPHSKYGSIRCSSPRVHKRPAMVKFYFDGPPDLTLPHEGGVLKIPSPLWADRRHFPWGSVVVQPGRPTMHVSAWHGRGPTPRGVPPAASLARQCDLSRFWLRKSLGSRPDLPGSGFQPGRGQAGARDRMPAGSAATSWKPVHVPIVRSYRRYR